MTFLDDHQGVYKLKGVELVHEMLNNIPPELLRRTGMDGLLHSVRTAQPSRKSFAHGAHHFSRSQNLSHTFVIHVHPTWSGAQRPRRYCSWIKRRNRTLPNDSIGFPHS